MIFGISINGNGAVTVAQYSSVEHPTSPDSYDEAVNLAGLLNAVVTVTDGDGDVATGTVGIGAAISFEDDGPSADITLTGTSAVLDELLGADPADLNAASDDNVAGNPFPPIYGTPIGLVSNVDLVDTTTATGEDDEGATTVVSLQIVGGPGSDSGLETTNGTRSTCSRRRTGA